MRNFGNNKSERMTTRSGNEERDISSTSPSSSTSSSLSLSSTSLIPAMLIFSVSLFTAIMFSAFSYVWTAQKFSQATNQCDNNTLVNCYWKVIINESMTPSPIITPVVEDSSVVVDNDMMLINNSTLWVNGDVVIDETHSLFIGDDSLQNMIKTFAPSGPPGPPGQPGQSTNGTLIPGPPGLNAYVNLSVIQPDALCENGGVEIYSYFNNTIVGNATLCFCINGKNGTVGEPGPPGSQGQIGIPVRRKTKNLKKNRNSFR